jgi:hypothetical protein
LHKKLLSTVLTLALVGGLLSAVASVAEAQDPPPASLLPDEDGTAAPAKFGNRLSDKPDGTDDVAHLTAVAPAAAERVQWRRCPTTATTPLDNAELATCNVIIGEDTEGKTVGAPGAFVSPDEAYDITWDIEVSGVVDIAVLACVGAGENVEGGGNCLATLEEGITVEDTDDPDPTDTSAGEITSICTAGPVVCTGPGSGALFSPWTHGDPVPNDGFTIRATTSPELNVAPNLHAELFAASSASEQDGAALADVACVVVTAVATHAEWECTFTDANVPDNTTLSVLIDNNTGGVGNCAGVICILDAHFTQSQARSAGAPAAYFVRGPDNADVEVGSSCGTPDTADTNALGDPTLLHGCLQDQFGDPFVPGPGAGATFEIDPAAGVGSLNCDPGAAGGPAGTPEDPDADFDVDRCSNVTPPEAITPGDDWAEYPVELINTTEPGDMVVTFCLDNELAEADPNHGCADELAAGNAVQVTKTWIAVPTQVFLAFGAHAGDPEACRTGKTFRRNRVRQKDTVTVCTFDANGNPQTTEGFGVRLQWFIETTVGGERTAVKFRQAPPQHTGPDGTAEVGIRAIRRGSNFIIVRLIDIATGGDVVNDSFEIEKRVRGKGGGGGRVQSQVTIRGSFKGQVVSEAARCEKNRRVFLKKHRPGKNRTVGSDRTNNAGNWRIQKANPNGRYYAKIKRTRRCTGDKSPTVVK